MRLRSSVRFLATTVLAVAAAAILAAAQPPYERIVVFGTSLSDPGNAFAIVGDPVTPPYDRLDALLVPPAPYARGGMHFSNGATWIEQLARGLGLAGTVRPAFLGATLEATNYAVGGARARAQAGPNFNLPVQLAAFNADFGGVASGDALYVVEMGGNDVRDAIALAATGNSTGAANVIATAVTTIAGSIQTLYAEGARHFLVWRVPDIGLTPALRIADSATPGAAALATFLSVQFNGGLDTAIAQLSALPGIDIGVLDSFTLLTAVNNDPGHFGLTETTTACVTPDVAPFACQHADQFLFWDGIHPTEAGHAILAGVAASALQLAVKGR